MNMQLRLIDGANLVLTSLRWQQHWCITKTGEAVKFV